MKLHVLSTILLVGACGGSDTDPGAGNDPGGGTGTLVIDGDASASSRVSNGRAGADFDTDFALRISLNGAEVTTGTVTVTSAGGVVDLVFDQQQNGNGNRRWRATAPGYDEVYILDVTSGADSIIGARVDGPDIHVFAAPVAGATVDSTLPLDVAWDCGDTAASAAIQTDQIDPLAIDDTGAHTLPPGAIRAEKDRARQNTIQITRSNRVIPGGAAGGSQWSVTIRNEIDVLAAPNPAL